MAIRTVVTRGYGNGTFNGTIPLVVTRGYGSTAAPAAVVAPQFTVHDTYVVIQSHLQATGYFGQVFIGQPEGFGDDARMHAAIWTVATRIPYLSFDTGMRIYDTRIRLYKKAFGRTQENAELVLAVGVQQSVSDLLDDYDLGETISEIDIAGQYGQAVNVRWGHDRVGDDVYKVADITLPLVVRNTSTTSK